MKFLHILDPKRLLKRNMSYKNNRVENTNAINCITIKVSKALRQSRREKEAQMKRNLASHIQFYPRFVERL